MEVTRVRRYVRESEPYQVWEEITSWCFKNFGIPGFGEPDTGREEWFYNPYDDYMDFYFVDPHNADLFILKWM